jgi:hypothetical protein
MLYQDGLGMLYEVPEPNLYGLGYVNDPYGVGESQVVYDGLGNPVGMWPFDDIGKAVGGLVKSALPAVASFIPGGSLISQMLPSVAQALAPSAPAAPQVPQVMPPAAMPGAYPGVPGMQMTMPGGYPGAPGFPAFQPGAFPGTPGMPYPPPPGWIQPQVPYGGLSPRRLYMRCSVWPGPNGLVPEMAAQAPLAPAQAAASAAAQTATAMMRPRRMYHYHRRR